MNSATTARVSRPLEMLDGIGNVDGVTIDTGLDSVGRGGMTSVAERDVSMRRSPSRVTIVRIVLPRKQKANRRRLSPEAPSSVSFAVVTLVAEPLRTLTCRP